MARLGRATRSCSSGARGSSLLELILHFVERGLRADLAFFAAGCARHRNGADDLVADFDRQRAAPPGAGACAFAVAAARATTTAPNDTSLSLCMARSFCE